ncbi:MAG: NUDIX domain-containing protein, partial [Nitrospirota bacterium]
RFVLFKRRSDVVMPGIWQPISGKILKDETIKQALFRQVEKKTGNRALRMFKLDEVNAYYDDYYDTVMLVPSAASLILADIQLDKDLHDQCTFVLPDELPGLIYFPNQLRGFRLVKEYLSQYGTKGSPVHELIY